MIGQGSAQNGLFYLNDASISKKHEKNHYFLSHPSSSFFSSKHCNKFDLCHSRLGHPSLPRFSFIVKNSTNIKANKDFIYEICQRAKQPRLPFSLRTTFLISLF